MAWPRCLAQSGDGTRAHTPSLTHLMPYVLLVCMVCVVTRLNVYLPDELAAAAKRAGLNLSAVTQDAVRRTLAQRSTDAWLTTITATPATAAVPHDRALVALDAVRNEAPTRHG